MQTTFHYDVIVIGAGHAGCEAAQTAARMGAKTCVITMDMNKIAQMSCNPAIGGIAKGQIVREVDALGGGTGEVTDACAIQFRMLNRSKGPAMWSPRAQCDRPRFISSGAAGWKRRKIWPSGKTKPRKSSLKTAELLVLIRFGAHASTAEQW